MLIVALGCEPDVAPELRAEIEELREQRIERQIVDQARSEADEAERELERARQEAGAAREAATVAAQSAEAVAAEMHARFDAVVDRNAELNSELAELVEVQKEAVARIEHLSESKRELQQRARWVRDQALAFAESLRYADPADVVERRAGAMEQFLERAREWFPEGPDPLELPEVGSSGRGPVFADGATERLVTLAGRFATRFELEDAQHDGRQAVAAKQRPEGEPESSADAGAQPGEPPALAQ